RAQFVIGGHTTHHVAGSNIPAIRIAVVYTVEGNTLCLLPHLAAHLLDEIVIREWRLEYHHPNRMIRERTEDVFAVDECRHPLARIGVERATDVERRPA